MAKKQKKVKKESEPKEIDVKEAVNAACVFLSSVFTGEGLRDIRLEEVEFLDTENEWLITLGFLRYIPKEEVPFSQQQLREFLGKSYRREYKSVAVDARTGKPKSIKMRSAV